MTALAAALGIAWAVVAAAAVRRRAHARRLHTLVASGRQAGVGVGRRPIRLVAAGPSADRGAAGDDARLRVGARRRGHAQPVGDDTTPHPDGGHVRTGASWHTGIAAGRRGGLGDDRPGRRSRPRGLDTSFPGGRLGPQPPAVGHPGSPRSDAGRARRWPGVGEAGSPDGSNRRNRAAHARGDGSLGRWSRADAHTARPAVDDDRAGARRPAGAWPGAGSAAKLGRLLRRAVRQAPDHAADRRVGAATVAAAVLLPVAAPLAAAPVAWAVAAPLLAARRQARAHEAAAVDQLPDVTDLLILTTTAGLPVSASIEAIGGRPGGPFGDGLTEAAAHVRLGGATADGLQCLVDAAGAVARPLVDALVDHDRYGTPLRPTLERVAVEARMRRRRRAEEDARRLPVTLLFPLVLTTLPAFFLLAIVPLLAGSLGAISP